MLRVLVFIVLFAFLCSSALNGVEHDQLVEACCCPKSEVDATFHETLSILNSLVRRPFFRYYKANLEKECPYWAVQLMCGMTEDGGPAPCNVCTCDENEVPIALRNEGTCGEMAQSRDNLQQENEVPISVDRTLPLEVLGWDQESSPWFVGDDQDPNALFIDLVRNPEANTGYVGEGARRVWGAIYNENCFQGDLKAMCVPERAFFRLLSGLHVSISTHVATYFYRKDSAPLGSVEDCEQWEPNLELFMRTVGHWPDRIDNLYFLYMFVLRAVAKAKPHLLQRPYLTGDAEGDQRTREEVQQLLQARLVCTPTFNETLMFHGIDNKEVILQQMRNHFFNISRLMDCLSCEKCRLWGKLQTQGLGTALRIVIEDVPVVAMERLEVVALVNLLQHLSASIHSVKRLLRLWAAVAG